MNLEGLTLKLLTDYLNKNLLGSKIYKISMPTPHSLLLLVKRERSTAAVLADLGGCGPVIYLPDKLPENPDTPPAFCMLLRKHLEEGRINRITQSGLDRVITFEVDMLGASSKIITKKIVFELTGKNSNIILVQDNIILDALRHVNAQQSSYRTILPGKEYVSPPPQEGLNLLESDPAAITEQITAIPAANILKALISGTTGIGKSTALALLQTTDILPNQVALENAEKNNLTKQITLLQHNMQHQEKVYAVIGKTNQVKTLLVMPPVQPEAGTHIKEFTCINDAVNFAAALKPIQLPKHEQLQKITTAEISRQKKKLLVLQNDLDKAQNAEEQKTYADTLMANIYQIKKGQAKASLYNIYDNSLVEIALSPELTAVENAQAYYKRYNKYKRAQTELYQQIIATDGLLQYLGSIEASLLTAVTKTEIEEISQELTAAGLIRDNKKKNKLSAAKPQPLQLRISDDSTVYIGKNNRQNDYVTFTIGGPNDLWFHTKDIPGSHVILKTSLPQPAEQDIDIAVQLAAYFSKARSSSNIPVDCTQRRFVKKPSGSKPGFVIFTNQKTYFTTPDETKINQILENKTL